jgi:hypothetical protein
MGMAGDPAKGYTERNAMGAVKAINMAMNDLDGHKKCA